MEIKSLMLSNLGPFETLNVEIAPTSNIQGKITVFIGNNGSGKTSILKAIATNLSWFVARLRSEKGSGSPISDSAILNGFPSAMIKLSVQDRLLQFKEQASWTLAKTQAGKKPTFHSELNELNLLVSRYKDEITRDESVNLPLIAFYPVERVVLDVPLKIKERHSFLQLDGYDNSLNQGVDFRRFFEWFRDREDAENETGIPIDILDGFLKDLKEKDDELWQQLQSLKASSRDRQLTAVRTAISAFMLGFTNLKIRRKPRLHMSIDKEGQTLNVLQLSQGEKSLMALVGDIARRLSMMNPSLNNPLNGEGVVLIDEVDMHLHPRWQRSIIERLTATFPNCQFILTTHSPLVISDCKDVLVYSLEHGTVTTVPSQYGEDANTVLLNVMDTHIRNAQLTVQFNDLLDLIQDRKLEEAKVLLESLASELPAENLEISKARLLLMKEELRRAKN